jgi:hypothetical protein
MQKHKIFFVVFVLNDQRWSPKKKNRKKNDQRWSKKKNQTCPTLGCRTMAAA